MKKILFLFFVVFINCNVNKREAMFCFYSLDNKKICVRDFEIYLGENNVSTYLFIKNKSERDLIMKTSLKKVEFKSNEKVLERKLYPVYLRKKVDYKPFFFEIKKDSRTIYLISNKYNKEMFYIGELSDIDLNIQSLIINKSNVPN